MPKVSITNTTFESFPSFMDSYNMSFHSSLLPKVSITQVTFESFPSFMDSSNMCFQISVLPKLLLTLPATDAQSERVFSALKRIKTYLRTTMSQKRLNWLMILHVHKERTDKLSIERIVNLFVSRNEERLRIFGKC